MLPNNHQNDPFSATNITLWGPSGAGKDWLINAFVKELEHYNLIDKDFHFEMGTVNGGDPIPTPLNPMPPINIAPTTEAYDYHYSFRRVARFPVDRARDLSARNHEIIIHNDKGQVLIDCLDDQISFEATFQTLINTQNIFLVLGPLPKDMQHANLTVTQPSEPRQEGTDDDKFPDDAEVYIHSSGNNNDITGLSNINPAWGKAEYLQFVRLLFSSLKRVPGRRNIAVCMTKADQETRKGDAWDILRSRYGSLFCRELEVHGLQHNIQVFYTSAAGYLRQGGRDLPNFQGGTLRDTVRWRPVNTAAPFFWIFEQIERASLPKKSIFGMDPQEIYMPFPGPRNF